MVTLFLLVAIMDHPQQGVVAAVGRPRGHEAVVEEGLKPLWGAGTSSSLPSTQLWPDGHRAHPACGLPPLLQHSHPGSARDAISEEELRPSQGPGSPVRSGCPPAQWYCPDRLLLGWFRVSPLLPEELRGCLMSFCRLMGS